MHRIHLDRRHWCVLALALPATLAAQKATEMYVPIGQSVGLSGRHTLIGRIAAADAASRSLRLDGGATTPAGVRVDERTVIWLDRSGLRQPNSYGSYADLQPGRRIEVKFVGNDRAAGTAEWIKVDPSP